MKNNLSSTAQVVPNVVPVTFSSRPDVGREYLTIDIDGWDDVRRLSKKVLEFNGQRFTFTGWNSDSMKCYFARPIGGPVHTATIKSK